MYIENPDEEQNPNQSSSSPSVGAGGGGAAVGNSGTSTGGNPSTIQPVQINQPSQSFATVQDYLTANKQQGEDFGNNFTSTVGQGVGQAKSAIDTANQNTQNEIKAATPNYDPSTVEKVFQNPTDQTNITNYLNQANANYTGPTSFESSDQYSPAASATNTATQTGTELGTTGGREQLLEDQFGVYGQGNKGLDQTLLQNSSAYAGVPQLAQNFKSVNDYLSAAANNINTNLVPQAQAAVAPVKTNTANDVANVQSNLQNDIQQRITNAAQKGLPGLPSDQFNNLLNLNPQQQSYAFATPQEISNEQQFSALTNSNNLLPNTYIPNDTQTASLIQYLKQFS